jgi:hypothetical protein
MRRPLRQMTQRLALQINEGALPRRVHDLQDIGTAIRCYQLEIVVVFAGQGARRRIEIVEFMRDANGFCFRGGVFYACLKQHAPNLICKS